MQSLATLLYVNRSVYQYGAGMRYARTDRILRRVIIWAFIADAVILSFLFIKLLYNPFVMPVMAATVNETSVVGGVTLGPATRSLLEDLGAAGLNASAVGNITRGQFSVIGTTVALAGDSIQVYEYPVETTEAKDASAFALKKNMHVYTDGPLAIFYMGKNTSILSYFTKP